MLEIASQNQYSLYPSFGDFYFDHLMPLTNPYPGRNVNYGPRHVSRETARAFWTSNEAERLLGNPDVIHSNNFWCPTQISSSRLIYTFYDMGFLKDPSWTTETNRLGCFDGVFKSAIAADWVVAISEASRAHYLQTFPHFPADRIRVIYPCSRFSNPSATGKRPKMLADTPTGEYWLNVGTIEPRKNQLNLAKAYARYLKLGGKPMPLVFAGGKGWLMEEFQKQLNHLGIAKSVIMTGYVTDDELIWLYRNCYANLYPTLFEGFGLPVLEGMQFGAATVSSHTSSIPEVAGDAAFLLPPKDIEAWAQTMLLLTNNTIERERLSKAAIEQAARFKWADSAQSLLQLYKDAVDSPKRSLAT